MLDPKPLALCPIVTGMNDFEQTDNWLTSKRIEPMMEVESSFVFCCVAVLNETPGNCVNRLADVADTANDWVHEDVNGNVSRLLTGRTPVDTLAFRHC